MLEQAGWVVLVHGGAKTIAPTLHEANRDGCRSSAAAAAAVLRSGGTAVAAAEAAIRILENHPIYNAGYGSVRNGAGEVEMDAAMMDGATLDLGAVAAVRTIRNPITAAACMLREPFVLLAGAGAEAFARQKSLEIVAPADMVSIEALASEGGHDTVGCVVRDMHGHLAAATSTGGLAGTPPGRIGDSPLPGCGLYADDASGAVSLSGDGEAIARTIVAARIIDALDHGVGAQDAAERIRLVLRLDAEAGAIVLDPNGQIGIAHNSDHFAIGIATSEHEARGAIHRDELQDIIDG